MRLYMQTLLTSNPIELMNISDKESKEDSINKPSDKYFRDYTYISTSGFHFKKYEEDSQWHSYYFICETSGNNKNISIKFSKFSINEF